MFNFLKKLSLVCIFLFFSTVSSSAVEISDVNIDETFTSNGSSLVLNGVGVRDKFFIDLYVCALYLDEKNSNSLEIIEADKKMSIKLHIVSSLITSSKMEDATREGFDNARDGDISSIKDKIESFISVFKEEIKENDIYDLVYTPNIGVEIYKNNILKNTIKTLEFKKALFGIWLGEDPAQNSLKKEMLN